MSGSYAKKVARGMFRKIPDGQNGAQRGEIDDLPRMAAGVGGDRVERRQGRNEPCACGSGRKFKRCCGAVL